LNEQEPHLQVAPPLDTAAQIGSSVLPTHGTKLMPLPKATEIQVALAGAPLDGAGDGCAESGEQIGGFAGRCDGERDAPVMAESQGERFLSSVRDDRAASRR
jgi:hypothetical protein